MSKARFSIFIYSIYLASGGAVMAFIPNVILTLVGHPTTSEPWIRLFGALAMVLGLKGLHYQRLDIESMFQLDVYTRSFFATFLLVLVLMGIAQPILLVWTVVDYGAALWTQVAIWSDKRAARSTAA
jgi:hypothetical protein